MAAPKSKMSEAELFERMRLVGEACRPAAPIDRRSLFSGRSEQLSEVFSVVAQPGQHCVIYGERGVGKTSLATVAGELLRASSVLTARTTCDASDDFASVWHKALGELEFRTPRQGVGFADRRDETRTAASEQLPNGHVSPGAVCAVLERVAKRQELAVFIDEFDRLRDAESRTLFADTIKALSDRVVRATIFLIGVADSVGDLVREHRSVERALVQIHMPRMSRDELLEIVQTGMETARMTITAEAATKIAVFSQGLPHYTQLLGQLAAQAALAKQRTAVAVANVDTAIERAVERAQQSIVEAYRGAAAEGRSAMYARVLLACALAREDEYGFFTAPDVREPLRKILGTQATTLAFTRHLERLADAERGAVLQKNVIGGRVSYRFENPLLQPYVAMKGLADGLIEPGDVAAVARRD